MYLCIFTEIYIFDRDDKLMDDFSIIGNTSLHDQNEEKK